MPSSMRAPLLVGLLVLLAAAACSAAARDTQERMRTYMANFPGVVGLRGSDAEIAAVQSAFSVVAQKRDLGSGDYALDNMQCSSSA